MYEPGKSSVLYEEDNYRVRGIASHLIVERSNTCRCTATINIQPIPSDLEKKLLKKGLEQSEYVYVPHLLIKSAAKKAIEVFAQEVGEYGSKMYLRSHSETKLKDIES